MWRIGLVIILSAIACGKVGSGAGDDQPPMDAKTDAKVIDGNGCAVQPCSILPQCGCNPTFACDVNTGTQMGTACREVTTPGHETATCNSLEDCDKGWLCLSGPDPANASCMKYCLADADCPAPRAKCVVDPTLDNGQPFPGAPSVCSSNCDPASTTAPECPSTNKCALWSSLHLGVTARYATCAPAGAGTQGANCKVGTTGDDKLCAKGYLCLSTDNNSTFKCRRYCTNPGSGSSGQCGGQACNAFGETWLIGGVNYGFCSP